MLLWQNDRCWNRCWCWEHWYQQWPIRPRWWWGTILRCSISYRCRTYRRRSWRCCDVNHSIFWKQPQLETTFHTICTDVNAHTTFHQTQILSYLSRNINAHKRLQIPTNDSLKQPHNDPFIFILTQHKNIFNIFHATSSTTTNSASLSRVPTFFHSANPNHSYPHSDLQTHRPFFNHAWSPPHQPQHVVSILILSWCTWSSINKKNFPIPPIFPSFTNHSISTIIIHQYAQIILIKTPLVSNPNLRSAPIKIQRKAWTPFHYSPPFSSFLLRLPLFCALLEVFLPYLPPHPFLHARVAYCIYLYFDPLSQGPNNVNTLQQIHQNHPHSPIRSSPQPTTPKESIHHPFPSLPPPRPHHLHQSDTIAL